MSHPIYGDAPEAEVPECPDEYMSGLNDQQWLESVTGLGVDDFDLAIAIAEQGVTRVRSLLAENSRQWIDIDDRMPEQDVPVLVYQQIYGRRIMVWNGINWRCEEPGDTLPPYY